MAASIFISFASKDVKVAQTICAEIEPPLSQVSGSEVGHRSACHFPVTADNPLTPGGEANAAVIA